MSYLRFEDQADGIHVIFADVMNLGEVINGDDTEEAWRELDIATLTRDATHTCQDRHGPVPRSAQRRGAGLHRRQRRPGGGQDRREATFDGYYAPVDNQPTTNKAKAGQTIPMKWRLAAPSFATSWEDYYRFNTESNAGLGPEARSTTRQVDSLIFQARCAVTGTRADGRRRVLHRQRVVLQHGRDGSADR